MKRFKNNKNYVRADDLESSIGNLQPGSKNLDDIGKKSERDDGHKETTVQNGNSSSEDNIVSQKHQRPAIFKECHMDQLKAKPKSTIQSWFRWLLRRDKSPSYGSVSDLSRTPPSHRSAKIHHSISADTPSKMKKAHKAAVAQAMMKQTPEEFRGRTGKRDSDVSIQSTSSSVVKSFRSKKRLAPPPPVNGLARLDRQSSQSNSSISSHLSWGSLRIKNKIKGPAPRPPGGQNDTNLSRPSSKFSMGASSSGISTMQSNSSYLSDQEGSTISGHFPLLKNGEGSLSPKPWYKRKRNRDKKKEEPQQTKEAVYDMWPEVQYSRQTLESKPTCLAGSSTIQSLIKEKRCSALSNISDLDQAAADVVRKAKMSKIVEKEKYDDRFYNTSPRILKQADFTVKEEAPYDFTENMTYDNISIAPKSPKLQKEKSLDQPAVTEQKVETSDLKSSSEVTESEEEAPPKHPIYSLKPKTTPIQKVLDDPELFYLMAKDTKGKGLSKSSQPDISLKDPNQKNFGFRMNNMFTPDVSTILEGSESVTSSTTVTDEIERDFQALAALSCDPEIMSTASDFRIDTLDLDDIVDSFAKEPSINENSNDQSLASFLKTQENENLSTWQELKRRADEGSFDQELSHAEKNAKWICGTCTLINNPWRLHCEACSSLRLPRPQRVDDHGRVLDFSGEKKSDLSIKRSISDCITNTDVQLQKPYKSTMIEESLDLEPTIDEVRQARLKKFDLFNSTANEFSIDTLKNKFENDQFDQTKSILKSVSKAEFQTKVEEFESFLLESRKKSANEKKSKKITAINTNGAVRNAVSIFDQKEQSKPIGVTKKTGRRASLSSNQSQLSDEIVPDNLSESSASSNRAKNIKLDIDIMTAINKFDEMAAIAEVAHLNELAPKTSTLKKQQTTTWRNPQKNLEHSLSGSSVDTLTPSSSTPTSPKTNTPWINSKIFNISEPSLKKKRTPPKVQARSDSFDKARKRFELSMSSDDNRRNSISVGSATFELMQPQEFACISAQHSERPSPTREFHPVATLENISSSSTDSAKNSSGVSPSDIDADDETKKAVNDHLKKLEEAISQGKHSQAAILARELASMQLACSTEKSENPSKEDTKADTPLKANSGNTVEDKGTELEENTALVPQIVAENFPAAGKSTRRAVKSMGADSLLQKSQPIETFSVEMYIEDRTTHQGPISLEVTNSLTVKELKMKVQNEFGFPQEVQRWILGRQLADDSSKTLGFYKVTTNKCPIFLYLVAPEIEMKKTEPKKPLNFVLEEPTSKEISENPIVSVTESSVADDKSPNGARRRNYPKKPQIKKLKKRSGDVRTPRKNGNQFLNVTSSSNTSSSPDVGSSSTSTGSTLDRFSSEDASQKSSLDSSLQVSDPDFWICPVCTLQNGIERPGCEACSAERPEVKHSETIDFSAYDTKGCIPNAQPFECAICFLNYERKEGVVLRECLHTFCRPCLQNAVVFSEHAAVKCPFMNDEYSCNFCLQDREIRDLVTEDEYKMHQEKSIRQATGAMSNLFHCKTVDCKGFCQFEDNVNTFKCYVCSKTNCLTCQAQHEGMTCKEYQDDINSKKDAEAVETKKFFDDIIRRGNGMFCPNCSVMLVRKWGCDWMRCPMCRCEICWVTRGPRWGPNGEGDTSGGCKCGIHGRKCHPKCTYCH